MWEAGRDVPDVEVLPPLDEHDRRWYGWYRAIDHMRSQGMAPGAIPLSEIRQYCNLIGYEDEAFFCRVIMEIDRRFLGALAAKQALERN